MDTHQFLSEVRDTAHLGSKDEAERVVCATLMTLGERLYGGEPRHLASQLPHELQRFIVGEGNEPSGRTGRPIPSRQAQSGQRRPSGEPGPGLRRTGPLGPDTSDIHVDPKRSHDQRRLEEDLTGVPGRIGPDPNERRRRDMRARTHIAGGGSEQRASGGGGGQPMNVDTERRGRAGGGGGRMSETQRRAQGEMGHPSSKLNLDEFLDSVARREGREDVGREEVERHVRAVFTTLAHAVAPGELRDVHSQLPKSFDRLLEGWPARPGQERQ